MEGRGPDAFAKRPRCQNPVHPRPTHGPKHFYIVRLAPHFLSSVIPSSVVPHLVLDCIDGGSIYTELRGAVHRPVVLVRYLPLKKARGIASSPPFGASC